MNRFKTASIFLSAIAAAAGIAKAQSTPASGFFNWDEQTNPATAGYTASPFLTNSAASAAQVAGVLGAAPAGTPLAVKINTPLTDPAAIAIFSQFKIAYVFCDFEDASAVGNTRAIADTVLSSSKSSAAFVGNFNMYPTASTDTTRPGSVNTSAPSFTNSPESFQYSDIRGHVKTKVGKQMANEALYPGAPDYKTAGTSDLPIGSGTPNIRSALFVEPIVRESAVSKALVGTGAAHVPWVTRFNNYGNSALGGGPGGTGFVQNAANPANGQLLSRGDFEAQILHYRLRGASSVNLFDESAGSVVGYSPATEASDMKTGWSGSSVVNNIFNRGHGTTVSYSNFIGDTGNSSGNNIAAGDPVVKAGAIWSGVYDSSAVASGSRRLAILISNLSNVSKTIDLPNTIGGLKTFSGAAQDDDYTVGAGSHILLTFKYGFSHNQNAWVLLTDTPIFTDNNRNGVGVPEPTSLSVLGLGAIGLLARRRRKMA